MTNAGRINIHGTGLLLGSSGVLIRGPSGAGKSLLALELLQRAARAGEAAFLVADDRVDLTIVDGGIVMHAPANIAGLVELRGRGIVSRPSVDKAPLRLVVDLVDEFRRMVEEDELSTDLLGMTVPRCPVPRRGLIDAPHQLLLVDEALAQVASTARPAKQKFT